MSHQSIENDFFHVSFCSFQGHNVAQRNKINTTSNYSIHKDTNQYFCTIIKNYVTSQLTAKRCKLMTQADANNC